MLCLSTRLPHACQVTPLRFDLDKQVYISRTQGQRLGLWRFCSVLGLLSFVARRQTFERTKIGIFTLPTSLA